MIEKPGQEITKLQSMGLELEGAGAIIHSVDQLPQLSLFCITLQSFTLMHTFIHSIQ